MVQKLLGEMITDTDQRKIIQQRSDFILVALDPCQAGAVSRDSMCHFEPL
jgi:hypothetical protein